MRRILNRPELGAACGVVAVWAFFALYAGGSGFLSQAGSATYLEIASELGILAAAVSLLMIAGEFDLSVGSMIAASGMTISLLCERLGWSIWAAIAVALVLSLGVGFANGLVVVRTKLPSFIVTLGSLFILSGSTIGMTRLVTGRTQVGGLHEALHYGSAQTLFASRIGGFSVSILWWVAITVLASWVLLRTRSGNWIFGAGGAPDAARNLGVPVPKVKIALFMTTSFCACLIATFQAVKFTGSDVLRGTGKELEAILAAVLGGTLLTGGHGSVVGAAFGALLFGMVQQGIVFAGVDSDWYKVFLGAMLITAVLVNTYVRGRMVEARR
ncbi:ABC transporter permease [Hyalangium minutum]|uniref:Xylose transport system permease protein XylH n=1 Tax=Hyalangium minutum TaxID=394096 RepID=A0A085WGF3_9BACT|nr:ABC transporter permease [Hyalangium minutum]KFE66766.1 Inositol transport system permease protein [Hyalangium minutum]